VSGLPAPRFRFANRDAPSRRGREPASVPERALLAAEGAVKSLIYQLPALLLPWLAIVV
jgi:hypothetical protein